MNNFTAPETASELRNLYRSAEARAARLRILVDTGRSLASANLADLDNALQQSAKRAAHLAGYANGQVIYSNTAKGTGLYIKGEDSRRVGTLRLDGRAPTTPLSREDQEAFHLLCHLIATAIDRAEREKRLEQVVNRLFTAQEDERRRVSQDLHDSVAQTAGALFRRLELKSERNTETANEDLELAHIAKSLVTELRHVIAGLRPTILDDLGLAPALDALAERLRADGYDVRFQTHGDTNWPSTVTTAFFRIGQEALNNIYKHAGGPCAVEMQLAFDTLTGERRLIVTDHGKGLPDSVNSNAVEGKHLGLDVMKERMMAIGGDLTVQNDKGGGVIVKATLTGGLPQ